MQALKIYTSSSFTDFYTPQAMDAPNTRLAYPVMLLKSPQIFHPQLSKMKNFCKQNFPRVLYAQFHVRDFCAQVTPYIKAQL